MRSTNQTDILMNLLVADNLLPAIIISHRQEQTFWQGFRLGFREPCAVKYSYPWLLFIVFKAPFFLLSDWNEDVYEIICLKFLHICVCSVNICVYSKLISVCFVNTCVWLKHICVCSVNICVYPKHLCVYSKLISVCTNNICVCRKLICCQVLGILSLKNHLFFLSPITRIWSVRNFCISNSLLHKSIRLCRHNYYILYLSRKCHRG